MLLKTKLLDVDTDFESTLIQIENNEKIIHEPIEDPSSTSTSSSYTTFDSSYFYLLLPLQLCPLTIIIIPIRLLC